MSATYKKNTEANTKVYDLNEKTMQALGRLVGVYATFEDTWSNVEQEIYEGHILFAEACVATDELAAQQHQARLQDEMKSSCESHDMALMDMKEFTSKGRRHPRSA